MKLKQRYYREKKPSWYFTVFISRIGHAILCRCLEGKIIKRKLKTWDAWGHHSFNSRRPQRLKPSGVKRRKTQNPNYLYPWHHGRSVCLRGSGLSQCRTNSEGSLSRGVTLGPHGHCRHTTLYHSMKCKLPAASIQRLQRSRPARLAARGAPHAPFTVTAAIGSGLAVYKSAVIHSAVLSLQR